MSQWKFPFQSPATEDRRKALSKIWKYVVSCHIVAFRSDHKQMSLGLFESSLLRNRKTGSKQEKKRA